MTVCYLSKEISSPHVQAWISVECESVGGVCCLCVLIKRHLAKRGWLRVDLGRLLCGMRAAMEDDDGGKFYCRIAIALSLDKPEISLLADRRARGRVARAVRCAGDPRLRPSIG